MVTDAAERDDELQRMQREIDQMVLKLNSQGNKIVRLQRILNYLINELYELGPELQTKVYKIEAIREFLEKELEK